MESPCLCIRTASRQSLSMPLKKKTGRQTLCNKPYSGTEALKNYGEEHMRTGALIVYTSADSVFQIAAHESVVPVAELYRYCELARGMLDVGRVIARPFTGTCAADFRRTANRHDYSLKPPKPTMLDAIHTAGLDTIGVGKIYDIFDGQGVSEKNQDDRQRQWHGSDAGTGKAGFFRPCLCEPGGFRHAVRPPQRCGRLCRRGHAL